MNNVVQLKSVKDKTGGYLSGRAICLACKHEWEAVSPTGTIWLECPACTLERGRYIAQCEREGKRWFCNCDNDLFYVTSEGFYCPNCGEWQHGF